LVCRVAAIQARRITAQGTRTTTADTKAAPTLHLTAVVEMEAVGTEEDIDDDPSA
jgi:hypothetical protein